MQISKISLVWIAVALAACSAKDPTGGADGGAGVADAGADAAVHMVALPAVHDTWIDASDPTGATHGVNGGDLKLKVAGGAGTAAVALLQFDLSSVPAGSHVRVGSLELCVPTNVAVATSPNLFTVHEVMRAWVEGQATWQAWKTGQTWDTPGAAGMTERAMAAGAQIAPADPGCKRYSLNAKGLAMVQGWIDQPASNHGLLIANGMVIDGFQMESRESTNVPTLHFNYDDGMGL